MKKMIVLFIAAAALVATAAPELPDATAAKLPRWRGFNLLEKFNVGNAGPFHEEDFQLLAELGFNFVRLPMDYRIWIKDHDWKQINGDALKEIDQAVEFGKKYGVHTCLNFHRAPGYTVAHPPEAKQLWTNDEALAVCAMHWAYFAKHYKGVPNRNVSFDLMNEPPDVKPEVHEHVVRALVEAIRKEDLDRLIIADGRAWGTKPATELAGLHIAQATRGYAPMQISHYKASWVHGENFPMPTWPMLKATGMIYGPEKKEYHSPMIIEGDFHGGTLRIHVREVSNRDDLVVRADGEQIWSHRFAPGHGDADCKSVDKNKSWPFGTYDRDYSIPLRAGVKKIELVVTNGDWMSLQEIGISKPGSREVTLGLAPDWGKTNGVIRFDGTAFGTAETYNRESLWREMIEPWKALEKQGVGVVVGEWGSYCYTPHDVALRWMEDCLKNWKEAGWGWAMWNFRGGFGPLDSSRSDVNYEDFHGHKLDREMMTLIQKY